MHYWKIGREYLDSLKLLILSLICFFCIFNTHARQAPEITDATHTRISFAKNPKRIVTLTPALGELVADLLDDDEYDQIVGVTDYTDYPPVLQKRPSVGPYFKFNLEKVLSLKPDLVLATLDGNSKDQVAHLRELKVPVVVVGSENFKEIEESIVLVSNALGKPEKGRQMADQLRRGLDRIREKGKSRPHLKVLLQIGDHPLVVVGRKSFLHQAIEIVGGINVYADAEAHYPRPSIEDVIQKNPDVLLVISLGKDQNSTQKAAQEWSRFSNLKAVKNKRVQLLQADTLLRPTLRLLEGLSLLGQAIYGK